MTDCCPAGPVSRPPTTVGQLGLTQEWEGGQACGRQGISFLRGFSSQGPSPFQPHLAVEMAPDTSQIKVRGQPSFLCTCQA